MMGNGYGWFDGLMGGGFWTLSGFLVLIAVIVMLFKVFKK